MRTTEYAGRPSASNCSAAAVAAVSAAVDQAALEDHAHDRVGQHDEPHACRHIQHEHQRHAVGDGIFHRLGVAVGCMARYRRKNGSRNRHAEQPDRRIRQPKTRTAATRPRPVSVQVASSVLTNTLTCVAARPTVPVPSNVRMRRSPGSRQSISRRYRNPLVQRRPLQRELRHASEQRADRDRHDRLEAERRRQRHEHERADDRQDVERRGRQRGDEVVMQ